MCAGSLRPMNIVAYDIHISNNDLVSEHYVVLYSMLQLVSCSKVMYLVWSLLLITPRVSE